MNVEMVARNIQIILAPVVLVTACGILAQGLLGRYAAITERLRSLAAERLALLYTGTTGDKFHMERLLWIDNQLTSLVSHHKRAHDAVLGVYSAAVIFVADMFAIALVSVYQVA